MRALSDHDLFRLLEDDVPSGDLTTDTLRIGGQAGRIEFRARQAMTVCAIEEAARLFELVGAQAEVLVASGSPVAKATTGVSVPRRNHSRRGGSAMPSKRTSIALTPLGAGGGASRSLGATA